MGWRTTRERLPPLVALFLFGCACAAAAAGSCEAINYRCEAGAAPAFVQAGRATVMIRIPGAAQCTGVLVNNVRGDGRPYILTARHCAWGASTADLDAVAATAEIAYGFESSCSGNEPLPRWTARGAYHRAARVDAWLLEARAPPPADADAYLAGIELRPAGSAEYFGVHHGAAGTKQFVAQRVLGSAVVRLVKGADVLSLRSWHTQLLRGSTPPGSSGSALFDAQTRVNGLLSAGDSCAEDFSGNYYQQLAEAWDGDGSPATSLRHWLDADGLGAVSIDGVDASAVSATQPRPPAVVTGRVQVDAGDSGGGVAGARLLLGLGALLLVRMRRGRRAVVRGGTGFTAYVHLFRRIWPS